jgi:hypothetical protein
MMRSRQAEILSRLFKAARVTPQQLPEPMPEQLQTRILARWRSGPGVDDFMMFVGVIFRRALIGAGVVMLFCIAWSYEGLISPPENDLALGNYEMREEVLP